ncbi:polyketide synthase dehydratase domain-containing protein, partial [Actinocorallia sp. API 0066]|uniref:polyketide synthase dehydratase domain-containing protein n=1 Tax=Actinocorallia sp. API 0066 TaxID=2896846 RepID=UPI001E5E4F02
MSHAFHSPLMDPMLGEFASVAAGVAYREPSVAGRREWMSPEYWVRQVREPVRYADALAEALSESGSGFLVEIGPDGSLTSLARTSDHSIAAVALSRRDQSESVAVVAGLVELWAAGGPVTQAALTALIPGAAVPGRVVPLPTYPFQRDRYWLVPVAAGGVAGGHPLLGAVVEVPGGVMLAGRVSLNSHPWLADHVIAGTVVVPGAAIVEFAVAAGDRVDCSVLDELVIHAPLLVPASGAVEIQVHVAESDGTGRRPVLVSSRLVGTREWQRNAEGFLSSAAASAADGADLRAWPPAGAEPVSVEGFYERLVDHGYGYGPLFQGLTAVWVREGELFGEVVLPEGADVDGFGIHPALLDAALHISMAATPAGDTGEVMVPFAWNRVTLHATGATTLRVRATQGPGGLTMDLADTAGEPVLTLGALTSRPMTAPSAAAPSVGGAEPMMLSVGWTPFATGDDGGAAGPDSAVITGAADLEALGEDVPEWLVLDTDLLASPGGDRHADAAGSGVGELVRV